MLKINGVEMPTPSGLQVSLAAIDKYAERTVGDYRLQREIAAKKIKYQLNWEYLPESEEFKLLWNTLANLPDFARFTIPNPNGSNDYTFEGYIGDMSVTMQSYWDMGQGKQARWKSFKVNVIER